LRTQLSTLYLFGCSSARMLGIAPASPLTVVAVRSAAECVLWDCFPHHNLFVWPCVSTVLAHMLALRFFTALFSSGVCVATTRALSALCAPESLAPPHLLSVVDGPSWSRVHRDETPVGWRLSPSVASVRTSCALSSPGLSSWVIMLPMIVCIASESSSALPRPASLAARVVIA
jgi:hypothetical protein